MMMMMSNFDKEKDADWDDNSAQCGQDGNKTVKVGAGRLKIDKPLEKEEGYGEEVEDGFDEESELTTCFEKGEGGDMYTQ